MATSYPGSLDSLPRPTSTTAMNASGYEGDVVIDNLSDAIEAVQAELGTDPAGAQATVKARLENLSHLGGFSWRSGEWLSTQKVITNTGTTYALTADYVYYIPLWIPVSATLDRIAIRVGTSQASANCRIGLYASDGSTGRPTGSATDLGEIDASSTGMKTLTISQAVSGGQVQWVGILNEISNVALNAAANAQSWAWVGSEDGTSPNPVSFYYQTGATYASGFPTVGSLTAVTGAEPVVIARRT